MEEKNVSRRDFIKNSVIIGLGVTGAGIINICTTKEVHALGSKLIKTSRLKNNQAIRFKYSGAKYILVRINDKFYAYKNECTHKGGPLELKSKNKFRCKWHGAEFEPVSGKVLKGPAQNSLEKLNLKIKNGYVYIA